MDAIVDFSWRAYPGSAIMALGFVVATYGLLRLVAWQRLSAFDSATPIVFVGGLRAGLVGLAIAGVGAAWVWQQLWVLLIALAIGGEELLECSVILFVLRRGRRIEAGASLPKARAA
jgi:hypothetical protein